MNSFLANILIKTTLKFKGGKFPKEKPSEYELAKKYREFVISLKRNTKNLILIVVGIFCASFGFKGFLLTNDFIDGGATGISLLLAAITDIPLYILIIGVNLPFIVMGYRIMGKRFAMKTALAIIGLALCVALVPFPNVTNDDLLVAIFGGFFLGAGIGLAIRGGAVIDGTEILAIFLSKKFSTTIGDVIILINIIIFSFAAYLLSIEIALYSMITYIAASKTLDFIIEGIEEYIGVTIISTQSKRIKEMIIDKMGRGVTIYKGQGGYAVDGKSKEMDIIYTVITRLELNKLNTEIEKIEPNAFMVMNSIKDIKGGIVKKRPLKH
ncbi:membrane protein [Patiriisocius marinistellae]|uniref:Membrane protein n=1 Tax=Patiriisocius marinistellae TaxID=2494560 RepID=A0A5J4FXK0_9FLAO|nr:YitT family protein [Patiriisocius marinistellae]GEQ85874.1 membrane protein [Patiriisocius marinistellae]